MQEEKVVTLPSQQEIVNRLKRLYDEHTMVQRFYPKIARHGGTEKNAYGIANIFSLAIYDFMQAGYPPMLANVLYLWVPKFIDAIIDDQEVAQKAKDLVAEAIRKSRGR